MSHIGKTKELVVDFKKSNALQYSIATSAFVVELVNLPRCFIVSSNDLSFTDLKTHCLPLLYYKT